MATALSLELDPIFLKGLGFLHSKSKDSAEKLRALLDESMSRGSDSSYRSSIKVSSAVHTFPCPISLFMSFNAINVNLLDSTCPLCYMMFIFWYALFYISNFVSLLLICYNLIRYSVFYFLEC